MLGRFFIHLLRSLKSEKDARPPEAARAQATNPISEYFFNNPGRLIHKWHHYFEIYHRHFARFRGRSPVMVEIGVFHGGSLQMWRDYFGPGARIVGIDIDPRCRRFEDESTTILIGDQSDRRFLAEVRERLPQIDILIDDGGHTMTQQITTFDELYPHIQPEGIYLCEDIHTSLMEEYGGGYRREGTFLEYSKALVDRLYGWHSREPNRLTVDDMTRTTFALHFYDSVLVMEKRPMKPPQSTMTGTPSF
jgi:23S rRNA U2552 (ribose-2'-O)-methylase RlmE/FtsJ